MRCLSAMFLFLAGCPGDKATLGDTGIGGDTSSGTTVDSDGDGFSSPEDCDDTDAGVNPGAEEIWYDGVDQDCDGASDYDADADGREHEDYGGDDCDDEDPDSRGAEADVVGMGAGPDCGTMGVDAMIYGAFEGDQVSKASGEGDIDGDGVGDLVVSAGGTDSADGTVEDVGATYIILGPVTGAMSTADAAAVIYGHDDVSAYMPVGIADFDADGFGDFAVAGRAGDGLDTLHYYLGPLSGEYILEDSDGLWTLDPSMNSFIDDVGDTDGDGTIDVLGGCYASGCAAVLMPGLASGDYRSSDALATIEASRTETCSGFSSAAGDVNADGLADIQVACDDAAFLFYGPIAGALDTSSADASTTLFSPWVRHGGDTDADGYDDILVSTIGTAEEAAWDGVGYGYVLGGPLSGDYDAAAAAVATWTGTHFDNFAFIASGGADLDADGTSDFGIVSHHSGAYNTYSYSFVLSPTAGFNTTDDADWRVEQGADEDGLNDGFGTELASLGDLNDDEYDEFGIVEMHETNASSMDGVIWLLGGGTI